MLIFIRHFIKKQTSLPYFTSYILCKILIIKLLIYLGIHLIKYISKLTQISYLLKHFTIAYLDPDNDHRKQKIRNQSNTSRI